MALGQLPIAEHSEPVADPSRPSSLTLTWSQRSSELHAKLTNQIAALQHSVHLKERHLTESLPLVRKLMAASQESPAHTAHALVSCGQRTPRLHSHTRWPVVTCAEAEGGECARRALPFSRYCLKRECLSMYPVCPAPWQALAQGHMLGSGGGPAYLDDISSPAVDSASHSSLPPQTYTETVTRCFTAVAHPLMQTHTLPASSPCMTSSLQSPCARNT